ncbi:uncharacterized protein LOC142102314 [Mixophyes fleayi]|uniref:uncharacterized protein LOC142102314 n=1 Tax=Mixophyes fleayi TaxID=3061075 RepID=UPI003F4DCC6B
MGSGDLLHEADVSTLSQITDSTMAGQLYDGSTSEPVGNIQTDVSHTFPAEVGVCGPSHRLCEQNVQMSHQTAPNPPAPASLCQRCVSPRRNCFQNRCEMVNSCESGPSFAQRHCSYPESFSTGETTAYGLRHTVHEHSRSGMEVDASNQNGPQGQLPWTGEGPIEREIAMRLRRIGDQMNERYLQRRQMGHQQWWGPLRWHLTQIISEIVAALYNPLVDILPQN